MTDSEYDDIKKFEITGTVTVNFSATVFADDEDDVAGKSWTDFMDVELDEGSSPDYEIEQVDEIETEDDEDD